MITLSLLHPIHLCPVQSWTFDSATVIRIGRAKDNDVVLYNALVAPYHAQLHRRSWGWELVSLSRDGTYANNQTVSRFQVEQSISIRLADLGPRLKIQLATLTPNRAPFPSGRSLSEAS